jgi:regulator of protease activity HflC (stomatin/prohibitin superfamily)
MKSGAFLQYGEPGIYPCLPWTEAKYLVSKQDFVYESPNNRVLTRDNLNITISLSILMKIEAEEETVMQLATNVP